MDYIPIMIDSIETSVSMGLFSSKEASISAHLYKSKLVKILLKKFKKMNNFNPDRLQKSAVEAYPINNRPRGMEDIKSVKYYQKMIANKKDIPPIWIYNNTLLDGAHRIVASYITKKKYIYAYVMTN